MRIKKCNFNDNNAVGSVLKDGRIIVTNTDTRIMYEVVRVKKIKVKMPKGYKKIKVWKHKQTN